MMVQSGGNANMGRRSRGDPSVSIPARNGNRRPNPVIFAPNAGRSNSCEKLATVLSAGEFLVRLPRYTHSTEGGPQLKIGKLLASCRNEPKCCLELMMIRIMRNWKSGNLSRGTLTQGLCVTEVEGLGKAYYV